MNVDCIFCRIVAGELPCSLVYDSDEVTAFLDIAPINPGHTLVVPKQHHDTITVTPDVLLTQCIALVKRIVAAQATALGADGASINQANGACAGQVVPHIHFHVIPRFGDQPFSWESGCYNSPNEMSRIANDMRAALNE